MQLYQFPPSGNAHKVRLALGLLELEYETVNLSGGAHKEGPFLALNPFGRVPVLVDGDVVIRDSQAILAYLGAKYSPGELWPSAPDELGQVVAWLSTAANEVAHGPNLLRLHHKFGRPIDIRAVVLQTEEVFERVDALLETRKWLVGDRQTMADIAMYPYLALAPEAKFDLRPYANVCDWLLQVRALPGYVDMPGMWTAAMAESS